MNTKTKSQKGFLLVVAVFLIVVVSFIAILLGYTLINSTLSTANVAKSNDAFYIAKSGLEMAKREIIANGTNCTSINGQPNFTNKTLFGGQFTVTGYDNTYSNNLNSAITDSSTSIPLRYFLPSKTLSNSISSTQTTNIRISSSSGLAQKGLLKIDDELLYYDGIQTVSGHPTRYYLQNVVRGTAGTIAASHSSGTTIRAGFSPIGVVAIDNEIIPYSSIDYSSRILLNAIRGSDAASHSYNATVSQNECILTSTGAVPTLSSPQAKRTVQEILTSGSGGGGGYGFNVGGFYPRVSAAKQVILNGQGIITNLEATCPDSDSDPGAGTSLVSGGNVTFNGQAMTLLASGPCSMPPHSGGFKPDVQLNLSGIDPLWQSYFGDHSFTEVTSYNPATCAVNPANYDDIINCLEGSGGYPSTLGKTITVTGSTMIINGTHANVTVGSPTQPVVLIVNTSGGIIFNGNQIQFTVYGLLYIIGSNNNFIINGNGHITIHGAMGTEGSITFNGNAGMTEDSETLSLLPSINPYLNLEGGGTIKAYESREIFK